MLIIYSTMVDRTICVVSLAFLAFLVIPNTGANCPSPWVAHGSSCYMFMHANRTNWFHAEHQCLTLGAYLVHVEDADEGAFLKQTIRRIHVSDDPQTIGYWTAGNDLEVEGQWVWGYPEGVAITYTDWFPGEPNNRWYDNRPEDCVVIWGHSHQNYTWNDQPCDNSDYFICETPGDINIVGK